MMSLLIPLPIILSVNTAGVEAKVEVEYWHDIENIGGYLSPGYCHYFGPRYPFAVSVHINTVTPTGNKVSVIITENDRLKWGGLLGPGQRSPTLYCTGKIEMHISNPDNQPTIYYSGYIDWVMN